MSDVNFLRLIAWAISIFILIILSDYFIFYYDLYILDVDFAKEHGYCSEDFDQINAGMLEVKDLDTAYIITLDTREKTQSSADSMVAFLHELGFQHVEVSQEKIPKGSTWAFGAIRTGKILHDDILTNMNNRYYGYLTDKSLSGPIKGVSIFNHSVANVDCMRHEFYHSIGMNHCSEKSCSMYHKASRKRKDDILCNFCQARVDSIIADLKSNNEPN